MPALAATSSIASAISSASAAPSAAPPNLSIYASNWEDNYKSARLPEPNSGDETVIVADKKPSMAAARIARKAHLNDTAVVAAQVPSSTYALGQMNATNATNANETTLQIESNAASGLQSPTSVLLRTCLCVMMLTASFTVV